MTVKKSNIFMMLLSIYFVSVSGGLSLGEVIGTSGRTLNYLLVITSMIGMYLWLTNGKVIYLVKSAILRSPGLILLGVFFTYFIFRLHINSEYEYFIKFSILLFTPLLAVVVASVLPQEEIFKALFFATYFGVLLSVFMAVLVPSIGTMDFARGSGWSGIFSQKNSFGRFALILCVLSLWSNISVSGFIKKSGFIIGLVAVVFSESRTSLLMLAILLSLHFTFISYNYIKAFRPVIVIFILAFLLSIIIFINSEYFLFDLAGQVLKVYSIEVNMTGRLPIWDYLLSIYSSSPVLGLGFDSIWAKSTELGIEESLGWKLTDAHNGYLDVLLQGGLIGLIIWSILLVLFARASLSWRTCTDGNEKFLWFSIFTYVVFVNLTSSHFLEVFSNVNFLISLCFACRVNKFNSILYEYSHG